MEEALQKQGFRKSDRGAEKDAGEKAEASAFHASHDAEKGEESRGAEQSLFNLDSRGTGQQRDQCAKKGDQLIAYSNAWECIGVGYESCSVIFLIISVHNIPAFRE